MSKLDGNVAIANNSVGLVPVAGGDIVNSIGSSAENVCGWSIMDSNTKAIVWTLDGGTARVWFGGATPTASVGMLLTDGASGTWSRRTAQTAKIILASGTPVFSLSQMTYQSSI